ncbi:hypothetical protein [Dyella jiangningensis]|uniref:Uncharacterized protein n=1 Tax=Dyella jiangningensis TaxID=1379159 RepID=A0A328P2S4_9GAMM|nr:hypothetical protein [Dyella jiangningensis]RAO74952.1 hypothetical protein CA260_12575 [Dyella jiangningensis]
MTTSANIPGIHNLLDRDKDFHNLDRRILAVDNAMLPIMEGIGAIGCLMSARDKVSGLAEEALADTGYLLTFLADLAGKLQQIKDEAISDQLLAVRAEMAHERR